MSRLKKELRNSTKKGTISSVILTACSKMNSYNWRLRYQQISILIISVHYIFNFSGYAEEEMLLKLFWGNKSKKCLNDGLLMHGFL